MKVQRWKLNIVVLVEFMMSKMRIYCNEKQDHYMRRSIMNVAAKHPQVLTRIMHLAVIVIGQFVNTMTSIIMEY